MSNSVTAIQEEPKGLIDPARVLEKAYSSTKARGSSTACIIALTDEVWRFLDILFFQHLLNHSLPVCDDE